MLLIRILLIFFFTCKGFFASDIIEPIKYISSDISKDLINTRVKGSHIKVFIPSIPYSYISKLINGTLFRISDNEKGFEAMMATSYKKINDLTYDVNLRKGVKFQDGSSFDADIVVKNFKAFIKHPFTYTDIHNRLKDIKKIDKYKVRFFLNKPYGMFLNDLARINLYSNAYLDRFSWQGKETGDSTKEPGLYGLGAYILKKGYATGKKQTEIVELEANPYYYEKGLPYIEKITIFTQLKTDKAVDMIINHEGMLDISPIPFNKKSEAVQSKYAKLITTPSTNNIAIYFNLLKKDTVLKDKRVRIALNQAINQKNLLNFVYKKEGEEAPTSSSINYKSIKKAVSHLKLHKKLSKEEIFNRLNGLKLKVLTQDRFMFLLKGIEYQLKQYGIKLEYSITSSEKDIYKNLLTNRDNPKEWDLLVWGNDDWYGNHPWTTFFTYRTSSPWSAIDKDEVMQKYINDFFEAQNGSKKFQDTVDKIVQRAYDEAYMLAVPSVHVVLAVNKEVYFEPTSIALMPLYKAKISKYHWSVRKGIYPSIRQRPMYKVEK
ncbi:ABC transporter substrate-binding protein [Sulfurospirillum sp. 1307]